MEYVRQGTMLGRILDWCEQQEASDLHAQENGAYFIRVHGKLRPIPNEAFPAPSNEQIHNCLAENFSPPICKRIATEFETDLSFYHGTLRYRANFSKQKGLQSFSFRVVPQQRMRLKDLQLPTSLRKILDVPRGLVLVTGSTGQGKSTTVRALIQEINETRSMRIITIEDPIEYVFQPVLSQFEQREVGIDTASFADGIRNAMRQDPNVIFIGEIRDRESIWTAMQAAETGHLVITTLHADSSAQAIGRIREFYPQAEQDGISSLLARNLNCIIGQRLIPNVMGTRTPCLEIAKRDAGVQEAIRNNDLTLLSGIVEAAIHSGMHSFDQYLMELIAAGVVSEETARYYAVNRHKLDLALRGISVIAPILKPKE